MSHNTNYYYIFDGDIHIWHNNCLWCVDDNTGMTLESKDQGQIYLNLSTARKANSSYIFDGGCSFLAQCLPMVCS